MVKLALRANCLRRVNLAIQYQIRICAEILRIHIKPSCTLSAFPFFVDFLAMSDVRRHAIGQSRIGLEFFVQILGTSGACAFAFIGQTALSIRDNAFFGI